MAMIKLKMDMHNVLRECPHEERDTVRNANAVVHPFMVPLITELSKKRPLWTFVAVDSWGATSQANGTWTYTRFDVMLGDEKLGWISSESHWRTSARSYMFTCRKLDRARSRGTCNMTKDLKKATKTIIESFHEMSYTEYVRAARGTTSQAISRRHSSVRYAFTNSLGKGEHSIMQFIAARQEEFLASLNPVQYGMLNDLVAKYNAFAEVESVSVAYAKDKGTVVKLLGDRYITQKLGSTEVYTYNNENLPDNLRGPIGMLKLVGEGAVIPDIGARGAEGTFFIVPEQVSDE